MGCSFSLGDGASSRHGRENDEDFLDSRDREEDIAKFPYVEFTGRDSITCPTCQGTGCIPTDQVNELVALIPYSDQRLRPQRTKLYVLLSVLLCLLVSGLVVFFLFPHSVLVEDEGIKVVQVWFDQKNSIVILAITTTLRIKNSNFYSVAVASIASQVQYMNTVVGTHQMTNVSRIQPLSDKLVKDTEKLEKIQTTEILLGRKGVDLRREAKRTWFESLLVNFTVKSEMGGPFSYVYFFCTLSKVKVHNIAIFMRTSVKISYIGHVTQSSLETYHYVDCGANSTTVQDSRPVSSPPSLNSLSKEERML